MENIRQSISIINERHEKLNNDMNKFDTYMKESSREFEDNHNKINKDLEDISAMLDDLLD